MAKTFPALYLGPASAPGRRGYDKRQRAVAEAHDYHDVGQECARPELKPAAAWLSRLSGVGIVGHGGILAEEQCCRDPRVECG